MFQAARRGGQGRRALQLSGSAQSRAFQPRAFPTDAFERPGAELEAFEASGAIA